MNDVDAPVPAIGPLKTRPLTHTAIRQASARPTAALWPRRDVLLLNWLPLVAFLTLALTLRPALPAWGFMWAMAAALFLAAKWITVVALLRRTDAPQIPRLLAYCFLWPGMDPKAFCADSIRAAPRVREWAAAAAKVAFGAALVWVILPHCRIANSLTTGWLGIVGLVLLLHFGVFHLVSLCWRQHGRDARPIMLSPALTPSLTAFWGGRWNNAFSDLMHRHFLPAFYRRFGMTAALLLIFLLSGVLHELVISVPARGGYGFPTAYFFTQGLGVLLERSRLGNILRLKNGWPGRLFALGVAGTPAFWLFNPTFIRNVMLPMLHAIGAT